MKNCFGRVKYGIWAVFLTKSERPFHMLKLDDLVSSTNLLIFTFEQLELRKTTCVNGN